MRSRKINQCRVANSSTYTRMRGRCLSHLRAADAQRSIVAFASGGAPPPMISQCMISFPWKHGGVDGLLPPLKYQTPSRWNTSSPSLWQAPTQQPPFHCEFFSPTHLVSDSFFSFHAIVCGPSQQQQLRHGHGDPRTQKQYVFSSMVIWSPSILRTAVHDVQQVEQLNMHFAQPSSGTAFTFVPFVNDMVCARRAASVRIATRGPWFARLRNE